jgi:hypothetical protein
LPHSGKFNWFGFCENVRLHEITDLLCCRWILTMTLRLHYFILYAPMLYNVSLYTFVVCYVNIETKNCICSLKFTDESDFIVLSPTKRAHLATARHPAPYSQNLRWVDFTYFWVPANNHYFISSKIWHIAQRFFTQKSKA